MEFAGFLNQSRILQAYQDADCLVLPSDNGETWGLVVNEAMASGLPVVVSDQVGCHPDLVAQGVTGYVYPCGDTSALAAHMHTMCAAPGAAFLMGQAACQRVRQQFSYEQVVAGIKAAVTQVCKPVQKQS